MATAQIDLFNTIEQDLSERIDAAQQSGKLQPVERAVLLKVSRRYGQERAISIATMQKIWGYASVKIYSDRAIKQAVKTLLEEFAIPIGSCRIPGRAGYYLIVSPQDAIDAERPLRNEIYSMFRRLKVINPRSAFVRHLNGQIELWKANTPDSE